MSIYRSCSFFSLSIMLMALNPAHAADAAPKAVIPAGAAVNPARAVPDKQAKARLALDDSFKAFCNVWGGKLHDREVYNLKQMKWDSGQNWVQATYVGYSEPLSCAVEADSGTVPVGKIIYHEVVYEKRGGSVPEAEREPGKAVETTEVTEIFRYQNGKWIY